MSREQTNRIIDQDQILSRITPPPATKVRRMVGRVTKLNVNPAVGKYVLVNPVAIGGIETEGSAVTKTPDTSQAIPVAILIGSPAIGDDLVCVSIAGSGRWVAEKRGGSSPVVKPITLPNCFCTIPPTLSMTSTDQNCNYGMFHSCTIQYGPPPPAMQQFNFSSNVYTSSASFIDKLTGSSFFYYFYCQYNQFFLTRFFPTSPYGSPFRDGVLWSWVVGGVNTCTPLSLTQGMAFSGSDASCYISIAGSTNPVAPASGTSSANPPVSN